MGADQLKTIPRGAFFKMDALNLIAWSSTKTCIMLVRIFASEDDDVIKKCLKQHHPVRRGRGELE